MVPFPYAWLEHTPAAERAIAAIAEGFCPFSHGPLDGRGTCGPCDARWVLERCEIDSDPIGFRAEYGWPSAGKILTLVSVYPLSPLHFGPKPPTAHREGLIR